MVISNQTVGRPKFGNRSNEQTAELYDAVRKTVLSVSTKTKKNVKNLRRKKKENGTAAEEW